MSVLPAQRLFLKPKIYWGSRQKDILYIYTRSKSEKHEQDLPKVVPSGLDWALVGPCGCHLLWD